MKQKVLKYDVVFEAYPDGGYTVTVPALPGCISEGDSFEEAKKNIAEAIQLYVEDMIADGEEVPNRSSFIVPVEVNFSKPIATI